MKIRQLWNLVLAVDTQNISRLQGTVKHVMTDLVSMESKLEGFLISIKGGQEAESETMSESEGSHVMR